LGAMGAMGAMRSLMSSLLNRAARRLSVIRCQCAGPQVACRTGAKARVYIPARCLIRNLLGKKAEMAGKSVAGRSGGGHSRDINLSK